MANSSVAITAGSGTVIDVELSADGDARQVVVIGDPSVVANVVPVVAKGTQGAFALPVQQLHNAGRTPFAVRTVARETGSTSEVLLSLTPTRDHADGTAVTTVPVTSGKRLRLVGMTLAITCTTTTMCWVRVCLRGEAGTTVSATSPIVVMQEIGMKTALADQVDSLDFDFGADGIEFSGSNQIGVSQIASATTARLTASLWGYEY